MASAAPPLGRAILSPAMRWAVGGWSFFIAENFVLSENRTRLISELGDGAYHAAYGTLSTLAMGSAFYGYFKKVRGAAPLLWTGPAPPGARIMGFACLSLGLGMASQMPPRLQIPLHFVGVNNDEDAVGGNPAPVTAPGPVATSPSEGGGSGWSVRCPFDFADSKDASDTSTVNGLERVTRHPGLWAFGLLGLGNALMVPSLPQRAWLAMPIVMAAVGGAHTDSRFRRGMGGTLTEEYDAMTSNVPFVAMLSGGQGDVAEALREFAGEVKPLNALIAVGVSALWVMRKGRGVKVPLPLRSMSRA